MFGLLTIFARSLPAAPVPTTIDVATWLIVAGPPRASITATPLVQPAAYRDADIYDDIVARLNATGSFTFVDSFEQGGPEGTADATYLATVIPGDAEDVDWCTPIVIDRHGVYTIAISVVEEDPRTRWRKCDHLANVARNALNGVSLADLTYPALTLVRRHSRGTATSPSRDLILAGEFTYSIEGFDSYNTADAG